MSLKKSIFAEMFGTAWLVLGGCGSAVLAATYPDLGIGFLGVALAFGLSLMAMAFAIGPISGCHVNPAVTLGLVAGGRFCSKKAIPYIVAQVVGGAIGAGILYLIATGKAGFDPAAGFASNGFGEHSPGGYTMKAAFIAEAAMTFFFLFIIMNVTGSEKLNAAFAPIAIGLTLTLIHLITIPVTNTSVNPARSTAVAVFQGGWALDQLWLFWVAPIVGAVLAGVMARCCCCAASACETSSGSCGTPTSGSCSTPSAGSCSDKKATSCSVK
jgi:aquaporin Z